jgi:hypothetical protein
MVYGKYEGIQSINQSMSRETFIFFIFRRLLWLRCGEQQSYREFLKSTLKGVKENYFDILPVWIRYRNVFFLIKDYF